MTFNWKCPFCGHDTTIRHYDGYKKYACQLTIDNKEGLKEAIVKWIVCPNTDCNKYTLSVELFHLKKLPFYPNSSKGFETGNLIKKWSLVPQSKALVFPDYVPKAIKADYEEACLIKDLSPKASATLARRCLQGMIRDFHGVTKQNLHQEIEAIKDKVDSVTWDAILATKEIGNIGAHMEEDINLIIDVEPNEASQLIRLIEYLIKEWYINRHEREQTLKAIKSSAEAKEQIKNGQKTSEKVQ